MSVIIVRGDAAHLPLPDGSADLVVTSPPYFGLRSYTDGGEHYDGQIGSEATPREYLEALWACTAEWLRVLKPSGSLFVNLGDKYSSGAGRQAGEKSEALRSGKHGHRGGSKWATVPAQPPIAGFPQKSLLGLPWRYALGCIDQLGLILRAEVIWDKPNGLPESVTDRVRRSHEQVFHFTRMPRYYTAVDEVREAHAPVSLARSRRAHNAGDSFSVSTPNTLNPAQFCNPLGKLPGSVWKGEDEHPTIWTIPSAPLTVPASLGVDHFAAYPPELVRRIILGWSPREVCTACGEGRRPVVGADWSKIPHALVVKRALTADETAGWCADFADWCETAGIARRDLDDAAGTSDMGGWWASRLPHRAAVPTPEQWGRLRVRFEPPSRFDALVHLTRMVPTGGSFGGDVDPVLGIMRRHRTGSGMTSTTAPPRTITGYACACPRPGAPARPGVVLDPFGGTGTSALVASVHGRTGISVDMSADYCRLAQWRTADPGERARALGVPKPPPVPDGQGSLFDLEAS